MKNKSSSTVLTSALALLTSMLMLTPTHAEIFKCVNQQGKVFYNDKPCSVKDKETKIKSEVDPKNIVTKEINIDLAKELENDKSSTVETDDEFELRMERERGRDFSDIDKATPENKEAN